MRLIQERARARARAHAFKYKVVLGTFHHGGSMASPAHRLRFKGGGWSSTPLVLPCRVAAADGGSVRVARERGAIDSECASPSKKIASAQTSLPQKRKVDALRLL
jgi:hypothetical protein